jgi:hypothetical protein
MLLRRETVFITAIAFSSLVAGRCASVHAQDALRLALFKTAADSGELQAVAAELDSSLLSELGKVPNVQVGARPALDLPGMQLAIDCVGETLECLSASAKQADAVGLVAPSIQRVSDETVVNIVLYDPRGQGAIRGASRRFGADFTPTLLLDRVGAMVRELFGQADPTPPVATGSPQPLAAEAVLPPPTAAEPVSSTAPILPIVLGAVGVGFIATGVGFGLGANSAEDRYAGTHVSDHTSAVHALDAYDSARKRAIIANVGFGVGAAAIAAGVVVFVMERTEGPRSEHALRMRLGLRADGLHCSGSWD